jgi:multiple sugar transport system permease protein
VTLQSHTATAGPRSARAGSATPRGLGRQKRGTLTHPSRTGILLVLPAFLFVLVLVVAPLIFSVYISLTNWPLIGTYKYIGLANYRNIGDDTTFWHATLYTLIYTAIVTGPIFLLGYATAVMVRKNRPGSVFFRTAVFLPYVIGLSTLSFVTLLEVQPVPATTIVCGLVIWFAAGLTMMLLMAAMQGIPREIYESADIDGASWWDKERHITLPLLRRSIALTLILSVIGSFLAFNQFYILTQGGPGTSTTTVVVWIYERAFVELHLGAATTLSLVLVVVVGLVSALQFFLLRGED